MKIKKNDTVIVLTGKDKGKTGRVLKAMPKEGKVIVEGINIQTSTRSRLRLQLLKSSIRKVQSMYQTLLTMTLKQRHQLRLVTK